MDCDDKGYGLPWQKCENEAKYRCLSCKLNFCSRHVKTKAGKGNKLYCCVCGYKVYPIAKKWVGSTEPLLKMTPLRPFWKAPNVIPKPKSTPWEEKE